LSGFFFLAVDSGVCEMVGTVVLSVTIAPLFKGGSVE
jgi:hypothetical protein